MALDTENPQERIENAKLTRIDRYINSLPTRFINLARRVLQGKEISRAAAVKLKCLDCVGFEDSSIRIRECDSVICALHKFRPYK